MTNHFFNLMKDDPDIASPYNEDRNYAHNIALEYLNEHPDFAIPPMDNGHYLYSNTMLEELETYCADKCRDLAYDGYDL